VYGKGDVEKLLRDAIIPESGIEINEAKSG